MKDSASRFAWTTALIAALGCVAALGSAKARAGDHKLVVSAVILARDTCQVGSDPVALASAAGASSRMLPGASTSPLLRCRGNAGGGTIRVRSDADVKAGADPVVLTIEP